MPFLQAITDAIANPMQVRLSQERASARTYAGLEPQARARRDTSPEFMPGVYGPATHHTSSSLSSRPPSQTSSKPPSRAPSQVWSEPRPPPPPSILRPTIQLQRSQSEVPFQPKQEFAPCITATDLTSDQIKKNYSCDDLTVKRWDFSKNMLPPLNAMQGFGRYRTAVNADPEWRAQHMMRQVKDIECLPSMTANLDMEAITGLPNEDWQAFTGSGSRRGSTVSSLSLSTMTDSSSSPIGSGRRVTHGFSPSGSSGRSSQTGLSHRRKGSTLSMMNLPDDPNSPPVPIALKRTSTMLSERRGSGLLSTIEELQSNTTMMTEGRRKIERPCEFVEEGNPDSAVASDAEDDECWTDVAETNPTKVSAITQMLKEGKIHQQPQPALTRVRTTSNDKKRARGSGLALDRSRTIRATRPEITRRQSKSKSTHERGDSEEKNKDKLTEEEAMDSVDKSSPGLEIKIANPVKAQIKYQPSRELVTDEKTKQVTIFDADKNMTQQPHITRNRSTTTVYRPVAIPEQTSQQVQLACAAK